MMKRFVGFALPVLLIFALLVSAQAEVDLSSMRFTVKGVEYMVAALQDEPVEPRENQLDGLPGHAILFGYMGGSDARESNMALYDGVRLIAPDGREYQTYGNAGNLENPYSLYFGLPEGMNLGDCTMKVPADGGEQWFQLGADGAETAPVPDPEPAANGINVPGTSQVTILWQDEMLVGELGTVQINDKDNPRQMGKDKMEVSFRCEGYGDHVKLDIVDGTMTMTMPMLAYVTVDGKVLDPVDATFYQDEMFLYFDTQTVPDTVTFYPHGDDDPAKAVTVDVASGLILGVGDASATAAPAAEPAPAPEPEPEPEAEEPTEPAPAPASAADYNVDALLEELSEASKEPWEKAIYDEGARQVGQSGDEVTFLLRSFDPKIKSLPEYGEDKAGWLDGFFENVQQYDIEASLTLKDGEPDPASMKALKSQVSKAAAAAKSAFDQKITRVALSELLLPAPVEGEVKGLADMEPLSGSYLDLIHGNDTFDGLDAQRMAPLFLAQASQVLNVKEGPHSLVLSCKGAAPEQLVEDTRRGVMSKLSKIYQANQMSDNEIEEEFNAQMIDNALAARKSAGGKKAEANQFVLDIDRVAGGDYGDEYVQYMQAFQVDGVLDALYYDVHDLPDAPAQDFPKSGRLSGSKSGTKVIVKAPKDDELGRYLQMCNAETDEVAVEFFIRPKGSATVYVPKGHYYFLIAAGETWYGVEGLFGENARYSSTADTEILSKKYYHTIELNPTAEGNIPIYGASMSDFKKQ